ncbi:MAG TPA: hypothetical protein VIT67_06125, partial [Povalibacter sp.]
MNGDDNPQSAFEQRSKALFDESVEQLNGNIRSRLTQARHQATEQADASRSRRRFWIPAAGLTAAALATIVVMPYIRNERSGLPESFATADDMAMLLNSD